METRGNLVAGLAALTLLFGPRALAQDADVEGRTTRDAEALVSAIADMASSDVAGAICADDLHRQATVLAFALASRERQLRAALSRRDATGARRERAVMHGLRDRIRALHAEAAVCIGETAPAPIDVEPEFTCILDLPPDVPADAMRVVGEDRRSAISE